MEKFEFEDLRGFLRILEKEGELFRITEQVDWNLEVGAVARKFCDEETSGAKSPAILFENIKDYPGGKFLTNTLASYRRYALALGLEKNTPVRDIIRTFRERIEQPIEPKIVKNGPCQENIIIGDDVDLFKFPTPKWHPRDGHRYIGTFHIVITKDPQSGWINWGIYRVGIHDKNTTGILVAGGQHIYEHLSRYLSVGKSMPVAIAIGNDPIIPIAAASNFESEVPEVRMAGALKQEPIKLVKCVTNDLLVPANSEIVLEGEIPPGELKDEGPFGEYPGYYGGAIVPRHIIKVKCITHRNNPIHTGSLEGPPLVDDHIMGSISCSAIAKKHLEDKGLKGWIKDVFYPPFGASWHVCIVSGKKMHGGFAQRVAFIIWGTKLGTSFSDKLIFVDEDIDPTNLNQVIWAIATRMNPERDIHIIRRSYVSALLPLTELPDRELGIAGRLIIDAAFPYEWKGKEWKGTPQIPERASFEHWPDDARNKAEEIIKRHFYEIKHVAK